MKYKFTIVIKKWFDKINGNTYHSVLIIDNRDGNRYSTHQNMVYGYGTHYKHTTFKLMEENKLLPRKYRYKDTYGHAKAYRYEQENKYPICWIVQDNCLKRELRIMKDGV